MQARQRPGIIRLTSRMDVIVAQEVAIAVRVGETILRRFGADTRQHAHAWRIQHTTPRKRRRL